MARLRLCKVCGDWHPPETWPHNCMPSHDLPPQYLEAPMVIGDTMRPVMSMTNGQMYDSKAAIRQEYRRAGVIEVGNDVPMSKPRPSRDEMDRAKKDRKAALGRALSRVGFGA